MVLKYIWILLLGCLLIFDVFCIINSDFFQSKSITVRLENDNFESATLFQNSYNRLIKPLSVGEGGTVEFDNLHHYFLFLKTNSSCKRLSLASWQISGKSNFVSIGINEKQKAKEVKVYSDAFLFRIINKNKHKFYGFNILIILFAFIDYNCR